LNDLTPAFRTYGLRTWPKTRGLYQPYDLTAVFKLLSRVNRVENPEKLKGLLGKIDEIVDHSSRQVQGGSPNYFKDVRELFKRMLDEKAALAAPR
jgi:hypothetical protein